MLEILSFWALAFQVLFLPPLYFSRARPHPYPKGPPMGTCGWRLSAHEDPVDIQLPRLRNQQFNGRPWIVQPDCDSADEPAGRGESWEFLPFFFGFRLQPAISETALSLSSPITASTDDDAAERRI